MDRKHTLTGNRVNVHELMLNARALAMSMCEHAQKKLKQSDDDDIAFEFMVAVEILSALNMQGNHGLCLAASNLAEQFRNECECDDD